MYKYNRLEVEMKFPVSSLVNRVLTFQKCSDEQVKELLSVPKGLTENKSECVVRAIERIQKACENKEKIFIGGDYDADGICATTILVDALERLGVEVGYYIPDRIKEGYGLHTTVVQQAYDKGYQLIITVDNGVNATDALEKAKELGIEVIVTDHHEFNEYPQCSLLVHPKEMDFPFQGLSGAGVSLQLAQGLVGATPLHLALAAIATMGDVMDLWAENRVIVRLGLEAINSGQLDSIQYLFGTMAGRKTEQDLAFQVVPKLNATGRLREIANPNMVVRYFLLKNREEIKKVAAQLTAVNEKRKQLTLQMSVLAEKSIVDEKFIILCDTRYHEGIVGILASQIANKYKKPTLVFTESKGGFKGSGRSVPGFDMQKFFSEGFDEFLHFGGHEQAIGCTIKLDKFEQFKSKVQQRFAEVKVETEVVTEACLIYCDEINNESFEEYRALSPFGQGFSDVVFAIKGLTVKKVSWIKQKFVRINFENGFEGICFNPETIKNFENFDCVYAQIVQNTYGKGKEKFSFIIKNME